MIWINKERQIFFTENKLFPCLTKELFDQLTDEHLVGQSILNMEFLLLSLSSKTSKKLCHIGNSTSSSSSRVDRWRLLMQLASATHRDIHCCLSDALQSRVIEHNKILVFSCSHADAATKRISDPSHRWTFRRRTMMKGGRSSYRSVVICSSTTSMFPRWRSVNISTPLTIE